MTHPALVSLTSTSYNHAELCEAPAQLLLFSTCWVFSCFRNPPNSDMDSVVLACVRDQSCVHVYTRGLGTPTSQHNSFDSEKLTNCSCAPDGIRPSVLWILSLALYQLRHPVTQLYTHTFMFVCAHFGKREPFD